MSKTLHERAAEYLALADKATDGPWAKRGPARGMRRFVEAPKNDRMPYALEVGGDDYTGYGDDEQRERDIDFIASSHDAAQIIRELLAEQQARVPALTAEIACALEDCASPDDPCHTGAVMQGLILDWTPAWERIRAILNALQPPVATSSNDLKTKVRRLMHIASIGGSQAPNCEQEWIELVADLRILLGD